MVEASANERTASCACGQLQAHCEGAPLSVSLCHCLECQKRTGSTFGIAAFFALDRVRIEGVSAVFERASDSGYPVVFQFCPRCGSTVSWYPMRKPEVVAVAVGAFADPRFPAPSKAVFAHHRHPWMTIALEES
ncbi:MAG: GFA family protein [Hyphomicrobiales bacterium]